ncbi:MAG TPA: SprT family zinc-dependent metalloprotease [Burkholderiaceae bacterium]|nr:SprT family zinc-dependent metalloprotease [Burkholderiaceae bacterium]
MGLRAAAFDTLQLSLFDTAAPAVAVSEPAPATTPPEPEPLRHPEANRELRLDGQLVGYALKRSRRRSIGFVVGTEGLSVSAPRWVGVREIEAALHEKARWVLRKLAEQRERAQRLRSATIEWRDGAALPFLGETVTLALDARAGLTRRGAVLDIDESDAAPGARRLTLRLGLPPQAAPAQIRDAVQSWLQRQARRVFEERCAHFAAQLGVRVRRLSLSSAQTRWGSASADGSIRLNWRLVHFALPSIDYVVAHELAHLRVMDHSPRFWEVVRSVLPEYEQARGVLKDGVVPVFD